MVRSWKAAGASVLAACVVALVIPSQVSAEVPMESPDFDEECFEWTYPDKDECGELKGKEECKAEPTINSSDDDAKKEACQPTKGDECFCD